MSLQLKGSLWTLCVLVAVAAAHGGHENVPEGSAVSEDPIVRVVFVEFTGTWGLLLTCACSGLHAMDSYDSHGCRVRGYLPHGYGAGCMSTPIPRSRSHANHSLLYRSSAPAGTSPSKSSEQSSPSWPTSSATPTAAANSGKTLTPPSQTGSCSCSSHKSSWAST